MKFKLTTLQEPVTLLDGKVSKIQTVDENDQVKLESLLVRDAFRRALGGAFPDEQPTQQNPGGMAFDKKMKRYEISKKLWVEDDVELSIEEASELKNCVGKMFSGETLGFLVNVIEKGNVV